MEEERTQQTEQVQEETGLSQDVETALQAEEQTTPEETAPEPKRNNQDVNWREMRQKMKEQEEMIAQMKRQQEEAKSDPDDDDFVFKKDIKAYKKQLEEMRQQMEVTSAEARLKSEYPDLDSVVTVDALNTLKEKHPALAETLQSSPNLYSKAVTAYTLIKQLGIGQKSYNNEKQRVQNNAKAPRTLSSQSPQSGSTPLSQANAFANGMTPELKQQMWREMKDIIDQG